MVVDYGHNAHSLAAVIEAIEQVPAPAPHVRLLDRRRPPRLRHHPPGRAAGRGLRPRDPLRGPLPPRPRRRRDHRPVPQGLGVGRAHEGDHRDRRGHESGGSRADAPPSPANSCSCRPTPSTKRCNGCAAIWKRWRRERPLEAIEQVVGEPVEEPALETSGSGPVASEAIGPAEIESSILAEAQTAAKI